MTHYFWRDPHTIRTGKSLLKALYIAIGSFVFLFALFHIIGSLYVSSIAQKSHKAFKAGIASDLAYLKEQGDSVANNALLQEYLLKKDSKKLIDILQIERTTRSIGLMGVANSEGIIIGRTKSTKNLGDNVFLTSVVGRFVSQKKSVESVEATVGFDPKQLYLTTGRPIMHGDTMIGALFANYLTDNVYATRFRDTYLYPGVEVLFYTKNLGVYGQSFSNPTLQALVNSYFNSGSEWIENGSSGDTVSFGDGRMFLVENITFPGLEGSPGGALLFIPRQDISNVTNLITAVLTLIIFAFFALRYHHNSYGEAHGWRYYILFTCISILLFISTFFVLEIKKVGFLELKRIPYILYNSTLRIQPEFGVFDIGFEQSFSIFVDTGDESINSVEIGLVFDPTMVEIKNIDLTNSKCSYVIENKIEPSIGKAHIACVILKSKGENGSLKIADVTVVPLRTGTFTLAFDTNETKVLAHDGLGTNVLRAAQSGSYRVDKFNSVLSTTDSTQDTGRSFVLFSPTHSNQSRWYNHTDAHFVWRGKPDAVYVYAFDNLPETIPSKAHTVQDSKITLPIPGDGIFYFHLQLASGGPVAHYKLQSDMTAPSIVSMRLSEEKIFKGDIVRFSFEAKDSGSGIQKNYYVDLGNHLFLPIGSQLFVPFLETGDQKVTLRVYDGANNYSEKTQIIHVRDW